MRGLELEQEAETTRRVLERIPQAHLSWRPHAKSMSLGQLAMHVANLPFWAGTTMTTPELDMAPNKTDANDAEPPDCSPATSP